MRNFVFFLLTALSLKNIQSHSFHYALSYFSTLALLKEKILVSTKNFASPLLALLSLKNIQLHNACCIFLSVFVFISLKEKIPVFIRMKNLAL